MKVKTKDLTDWQLDWAVAQCRNLKTRICSAVSFRGTPKAKLAYYYITLDPPERDEFGEVGYNPSAFWEHGMPIVEQQKIAVFPKPEGSAFPDEWIAFLKNSPFAFGPTPLTAAMRAYVYENLGDEVEIPDLNENDYL